MLNCLQVGCRESMMRSQHKSTSGVQLWKRKAHTLVYVHASGEWGYHQKCNAARQHNWRKGKRRRRKNRAGSTDSNAPRCSSFAWYRFWRLHGLNLALGISPFPSCNAQQAQQYTRQTLQEHMCAVDSTAAHNRRPRPHQHHLQHSRGSARILHSTRHRARGPSLPVFFVC